MLVITFAKVKQKVGMQNFTVQVINLIRAEYETDIKKPVVLAAACLQIVTIAMLCYLGNNNIQPKVWSSLYWISLIFGTLQASGKGFIQVHRGRWIYINQMASPAAIIFSRIIYGWLIIIILSMINLLIFSLLMDYPVNHSLVYLGIITLAVMGISSVFTMISAIASKTNQPGLLAPVLSLPVIIPLVLVGMQGSIKALNPVLVSSVYYDMMLLAAMNFLILVLAGILFTPLWRD